MCSLWMNISKVFFWCSLGAVKHMVIFFGNTLCLLYFSKAEQAVQANLLHPFQGVLSISVQYIVK